MVHLDSEHILDPLSTRYWKRQPCLGKKLVFLVLKGLLQAVGGLDETLELLFLLRTSQYEFTGSNATGRQKSGFRVAIGLCECAINLRRAKAGTLRNVVHARKLVIQLPNSGQICGKVVALPAGYAC